MQAGLVSQATVDQNAGRILRVIFLSGLMEHPHIATGQVDLPAQRAFARRAAAEGIVLLKNNSATLPLHASTMHTLAVIGPNASVARVGGGGSGLVHPDVAISPLVRHHPACRGGSQSDLRGRRHHDHGRPQPGRAAPRVRACWMKP